MKDVMALCWAAKEGDLDEIQRLVANGIDLDDADYDGRTCIHLAASEGQTEIIRFLIGKKVNVSPKDRFGGTPLDDAKRHGYKDAQALLEKELK
jgi:glutaminase